MIIKLLFFFLNLNYFTFSETDEDAASYARYFVETEIKGHFATFSAKDNSVFSSLEDFSQSSTQNGSLIFLLANIGTVSRNLEKNPIASFEINVHNCSEWNFDEMPYDPLACSRVTFNGWFQKSDLPANSTNPDFLAFAAKHPASFVWSYYSPHAFNLWSMHIKNIYYVGGYGDLHYIGNIDPELYFQAKPYPPA